MKKRIMLGVAAGILMTGTTAFATVHSDVDVDMDSSSFHNNYISETDDGYVKIIRLEHDIFIREPSNKDIVLQVDYCGADYVVNGITVGQPFNLCDIKDTRLVHCWEHEGMKYYNCICPDKSITRFNVDADTGVTKSITRISRTLNDQP